MRKILGLIILITLVGCDCPIPKQPPVEQAPPDDKPIAAIAPATIQAQLPDFSEFNDVKEKKRAFFEFLLPLVYHSNQQILQERALVKKWLADANSLNAKEQQQLEKIRTRYRVVNEDQDTQKQLLLNRVQTLPPSLVLAQAANESAWGTSRFAQEGNNLFGQWCYTMGCGLIPGERNHRSKHEVQIFKTPYDSVASYMRNLNSHPQYKELRDIRTTLKKQQKTVTGVDLAEGLTGYSERREEYVEEIQGMIRHNQLLQLDAAPLGEEISGQ